MVAQIGAKAGSDRFGDFERRKRDSTVSDHAVDERRNHDAVRLFAFEHRLDFAVFLHAVGKAGPAGALARTEQWTHQGENARWLNE